MRRLFMAAVTAVALVAALAFPAAAATPPVVDQLHDVPCVTKAPDPVTRTVPSARSPRLSAFETTRVVVTSIEEGPEALRVAYVVTVEIHDSYAIGDDGRRGVVTTTNYPAACVQLKAPTPDADPDGGGDERTERQKWINALRWAHYERAVARHDRPGRP